MPEPTAAPGAASLRDTLVDARARVAKPAKWCQGQFSTSDGRHCAAGAVIAVTRGDHEAMGAALAALEAALPIPSHGVTPFNDAAGRKHAEILALFDRAIRAAS